MKRTVILIICAVLLAGVMVGLIIARNIEDANHTDQWAVDVEGSEGLEYELNADGKTYALVGCGDVKGDVVVGNKYKNKSVTDIAEGAFRGNTGITSVTVSYGVMYVGTEAFAGCTNLVSVTLCRTASELGENIFEGCTALTTVTLPEMMPAVTKKMFAGCTSLSSLEIPQTVTEIDVSAFSGCNSLSTLTVAEDNPVYTVKGNCLIVKETGLLVWGNRASIIPDDGSVKEIAESAFSGCGIESVTIPASVKTVRKQAFENCTSLRTLVLSEGIESVGASAFRGCSALTKVAIPSSITEIGNFAFADCHSVSSVTVASGSKAFSAEGNCLTEIATKKLILGCSASQIPSGTKEIASYAFMGCGIRSVTLPGSVTKIANNAFSDCLSLTSVTVEGTVLSLGNSAFSGCTALNTVTFVNPVSIAEIPYGCFDGCVALREAIIPDLVKTVGTYAFRGCPITAVNFPASVTSVADYAFANCTQLSSITVAEGNTVYKGEGNCLIRKKGNVLMLGCKTSVIPEGVLSIWNSAFYGCTGLTSIHFPSTVTSLGAQPFVGCTGLTSITVASDNLAFSAKGNCLIDTKNKKLVLGCASSVIPDDGSVTAIDSYAFAGAQMKDLVIPKTVTSIGFSVFDGCTKLTTVHYGGTKEAWEEALAFGDTLDYTVICSGTAD